MKGLDEFKLCYVSGDTAIFTTADVTKIWGDDWNDAPYEHNAGEPYKYDEWMGKHGIDEPYDLISVKFTSYLSEPCDEYQNSPWCVFDINKGDTPWLYDRYNQFEDLKIWAGTTLPNFIKAIEQARGTVYIPLELREYF